MGKDQDLVQAVKEQDAVAVEKILAKNRNSKKIIGSVKRLNINQQDGDGMSVLHHAVLLGNVDIIQALLDHGSLVDMKDAKGMRPLHYGAWQGHDRPVELLLGRGSSVNQASTADGTSPLHLACEHGHLDVVRKLLKSGADVTVANNQNKTPLDLACEFGRTRVVELLLESEPCRHLLQDTSDDMADNSRTTCLHLAARNGHVDIIRLLLRGGIDINRQTLQGTSLHEAAKYGKTDVVRLLLSCGIDVTRLNSYEQTALEIVNKFTATRAAKELKHMLHDASSGIRIPAVSTSEPPTGHATATAAAAREPNHLAAPQSTEPTSAPLVVGIFRGGHRNGLESHLAALSGGSSSSFAKTGHTKSSDLNSSKTTTTTTGNQLKPFPWNRSSPQPSPVDHVVHVTGGRGDDGFLPPPSPLAKVKVFSSQDAGIASHGSSFRSSGPQKSSSSVPSVGRQSPSSWNGVHQHHHHLTSCPDPTAEASHRMSSGSNSSGGCSSSSTSSTPSHQTASRQNRLSGQSCESGVSSSRQSYHSSSGSSQGSLDHLEESGYSSTVNVNELIQQGLSDTDVLHTWLSSLQLEELTSLFVDAGYDMPTISRMTPEDLTAIGITKPSIRKKLKSEITKLTINDGIPDARPKDLSEWLNTLHLDGYRHTLVQQGYGTLDTVTDLTWEDLEEIGIKKLGHQKKIMLAIDRLTRINSTLHRLSASCSSSSSGQSSSAETLNHPESFAFAGKFVPGNPGSASSVSAQPHHVTPYEMPCPKSWKLRANGSGGVSVEHSDRPGVMQSSAGLVEIHASPNRQSPSLLHMSNMGSINHNTYPALPETSNESDVRTRPNARSTPPPLLDGDATPTNERKNSDRNQRTIKFGSKVKGASREEPLNFYQVEPHIARENGFSSYSTLPRKFSGKRKMGGFDNSFGSDDQYSGGFNGNPHNVSVMKESSRDDVGHFPSVEGGETASNKRKKEPPPLPKRINSFKTDSKSLYGTSRDKPPHLESDGKGYPPLTAGVFPDSASKASADLRLVASNNSRVVAGAAVSSQNTVRTSVNLSPAGNSLRSNQTTASDVSGNIANPGAASWQDGRMNEYSGDDSSDSGLESRHSASSVSLESSGSGGAVESNTLPFANENVGTIKQRNPSAKPSILTTADGEPGKLNTSLFENGSSTIRRNSRTSTERTDNAEVPVSQFMLVNGEIISEIAASNGNLPYGVSSDNVFNDIDGMLSGLTQELDEMLKLHG